MNEIAIKKVDFANIYSRSHRLGAAVFMIANLIEQDQELRAKIKKLSLDLVSLSVSIKDTDISSAKKIISDIEKKSLELMSILDIASISGLISKMNGQIIKEEFQSFISELGKFSETSEESKTITVKNIFEHYPVERIGSDSEHLSPSLGQSEVTTQNNQKIQNGNGTKNHNGLKRKDLRKNMILEFIKGHNNVSIKDIVPNVTGCSEKTVQRELIALIKEGKIKKAGERRWSKYSPI